MNHRSLHIYTRIFIVAKYNIPHESLKMPQIHYCKCKFSIIIENHENKFDTLT